MVFDGRELARKRTEVLVKKLEGRKVGLGIIYDPGNAGSVAYTNIKEKKARELGIFFVKVPNVEWGQSISNVKSAIDEFNRDPAINGIVLQSPFPGSEGLIGIIDPNKDVDGLREDSLFVPATVKAIIEILKTSPLAPLLSSSDLQLGEGNGRGEVVVVGSRGMVGKRLVQVLSTQYSVLRVVGMGKEDFESEKLKTADVVISATGQAGLIKPEMVRDGVICIDVGYPKGDFDPRVAEKASFFTPVPGGVGPMTVVCLFENLVG